MKLQSDRLILRPIQPEDKQDVFAYRRDAETNKFQGWIPETIDDVAVFISKVATQVDEPETWFQFVLIEKESGKLVGDLGIHFFGDENKIAEVGCTLDKNCQGKGYATESVKKVIDYLFVDLKKHRIVTSIDPENVNSIRLVERIGFHKEAHFRESLYLNGEWVDDVVYALLEKDWLQ